MTTCGELLIEILEDYGVDTVFGIPGVHTIELYRGLLRDNIRHVTPRHEQGAGFMADGYARVTGKPGVCLIITGPGMTNIVTAMGQAYGDSIPMLVISSTNAHNELGLGEGHLHELQDQSQLVKGVCAFSQTVVRPDDLPKTIARAFAVFNGARPRPVHIQIPIDIFDVNADHVKRAPAALASRPGPSPVAIEQAADMLAKAKNPVILLGGGTKDAAPEAQALVERLAAPTGLTINAKGVLPPNHPLSCGSYIPYKPMRELLAQADVVLAVGTEMGETDYDVYREGPFKFGGPLIRIDIESDQTARNYQADLAITSDAALALAALDAALAAKGVQRDGKAASEIAASVMHSSYKEIEDWSSIHKEWYDAIDAAFDDPIIVGDSTQPIYAGNHIYQSANTRSYFNSATGYGTLGYGLPAAIGAKIAAPNRPVICISGDGGLLFTIAEMVSGVEAKAGVAILLWNNERYKTIEDYMVAAQVAPEGLLEYSPDFLAVAKGFGCEAVRVTDGAGLTEALKEANTRDIPTLIEIKA